MVIFEQGSKLLPDNESASILLLEFPDSEL